ncbi:Hypothetical predicted protein [Podarcis lilfordi]|uniref:Uncharacterized protein n=1 Tax=Podarcis lilfordi TaxID=74358 RepID=A0AA35PEF1_9SAUR|nr:Hypothetical predicted protein [Podarcis lilfordi]
MAAMEDTCGLSRPPLKKAKQKLKHLMSYKAGGCAKTAPLALPMKRLSSIILPQSQAHNTEQASAPKSASTQLNAQTIPPPADFITEISRERGSRQGFFSL